MTTIHYTATGSVRGECGHRHRSVAAAVACARRDNAGCARSVRGGYSDRTVLAVEGGVQRPLDEGEVYERCLAMGLDA